MKKTAKGWPKFSHDEWAEHVQRYRELHDKSNMSVKQYQEKYGVNQHTLQYHNNRIRHQTEGSHPHASIPVEVIPAIKRKATKQGSEGSDINIAISPKDLTLTIKCSSNEQLQGILGRILP